jgi:hypothetical protein
VLRCLFDEPQAVLSVRLPEAPYMEPLRIEDAQLRKLISNGLGCLRLAAAGPAD